jgi:hypothetical protein
VFTGDFAQLPPVGQRGLHRNVNTRSVGTTKGQNTLFGRLLWLSIKIVVLLTTVMCQAGDENTRFVELLGRLRQGMCTVADYDLLNTRLISSIRPDWSDTIWSQAPMIVASNAVKDAINERATLAFADQTGRPVHWYHCSDKHRGNLINMKELRDHLKNIPSGSTSYRLGRIPLVIGMPVMIAQNFDVEAGIVNGCSGTLRSIRFTVDDNGERHAISCTVDTPSTCGDALPHLAKNQSVVLQDVVDLTFQHPYTGKKCRVKHTQLPIAPGFAMTIHKSQGQTLERVIVDLESCSGTESPYVMISRVRSLQGLLIMRPFAMNKIRCRQSLDSREEARRQNVLAMRTIACTSINETERAEAQRRLDIIVPPARIYTMMCAMDAVNFSSALRTMKLQIVSDMMWTISNRS